MRNLILSIFLFYSSISQSAITMQRQGDLSSPPADRVVTSAPLTKVGDKKYLIETGNQNFLSNPSFEHSTFSTGWTNGGIDTIAAETTNITDGLKSTKITGNGSSGTTWYQDVTPTVQLAGNLEYSMWAKSNSGGGFSICPRNAGSVLTGSCVTVLGDSIWRKYEINLGAPSSGSVGIAVRNLGTSGILYVDDAYVGKARNIGSSTAPNRYTANVAAAGTISNTNIPGWIGTCSISPTGT
jgi:hypothetical protein